MLQTKASVSDQYNLQVCGAYLNDSIEAIRHLFHHQQENQSKTFTKTITSCDVYNSKCIMLDSIDFARSIPNLNIKMQLATLLLKEESQAPSY